MGSKLLFKGMILGMEDGGAKFIKTDGVDLFFTVKVGSEIDNESKLKLAKECFIKEFGLGLRIKRVEN